MSIFKTRKNKRFNYKPIYFDQKKEDREKRKAERRISFRKEDSKFKERNFDDWDRMQYSELRDQGKRRMRFMIIFTGLILVGFYFLWIYLIPKMEEYMNNI